MVWGGGGGGGVVSIGGKCMLQHRIILHSELFVFSRGEEGGLTTFKFLLKKKNSLWSFTSELWLPIYFCYVANKQT